MTFEPMLRTFSGHSVFKQQIKLAQNRRNSLFSNKPTPFTREIPNIKDQDVSNSNLDQVKQGRSSAVERIVHIDDVAGSIPAAPTTARRPGLRKRSFVKYIQTERTRHGRVVYYFRKGDAPRIRLPNDFGSAEFWAAYSAALGPAHPGLVIPPHQRWRAPKAPRVYFVKCDRFVKIGTGKCPESRMSDLQIGNPEKLRLIFDIPGDASTERELHRRFHEYRKSGEWFRVEGELRTFIEETLALDNKKMPDEWRRHRIVF